jgi:hypothetical protein
MGQGINAVFGYNDNYLSGLIPGHYCWSSNQYKAEYGIMLRMGTLLGVTGSHTVQECWNQALAYWHYLNGLNTMNMLYQTNMAGYGGEHSVFQGYHGWFCYGSSLYDGKPVSVNEPFYPYYSQDNQTSTYGTAPGLVVGGPNRYYSGNQTPPANQVYYHRFYRDWHYEDTGNRKSWEVNEVGIYYTGSYLCLGSFFMRPGAVGIAEELPEKGATAFELKVSPNPGIRSVAIAFSLPEERVVDIAVYDLTGRRIATLTKGLLNAGRHELNWMPEERAPSGTYFVRFASGDTFRTEKITLLR